MHGTLKAKYIMYLGQPSKTNFKFITFWGGVKPNVKKWHFFLNKGVILGGMKGKNALILFRLIWKKYWTWDGRYCKFLIHDILPTGRYLGLDKILGFKRLWKWSMAALWTQWKRVGASKKSEDVIIWFSFFQLVWEKLHNTAWDR